MELSIEFYAFEMQNLDPMDGLSAWMEAPEVHLLKNIEAMVKPLPVHHVIPDFTLWSNGNI